MPEKKRPRFLVAAALAAGIAGAAVGLNPAPRPTSSAADLAEGLRAGKNFLPTPVHTEEEDAKMLALFRGLRVADVADAMDKAGLQGIGIMEAAIRPLWRDTEHF